MDSPVVVYDEAALYAVRFGAGLLGGLALITFLKPKTLGEAAKRVILSGVTSAFLTPFVRIHVLGIGEPILSIVAGIAFSVGFVAWGLLGMVAAYLDKNRNKPITAVLADITGSLARRKEDDPE